MTKINITATTPYYLNIPPLSGGQLRIFNLFKFLPENYKSTIIDYGGAPTKRKIAKNMIQHTLIRPKISWKIEHLLSAINKKKGCSTIIIGLLSKVHKHYIKVLNNYAKKSKIISAEFPYQFLAIKKYKSKILIYDAHNVEYNFQRDLFPNTFMGKLTNLYVRYVEKQACKHSNLILTCSKKDKNELCSLYNISQNKVHIIPNGVDTDEIKPAKGKEKNEAKAKLKLENKKIILFIGSYHLPNLESLEHIIDQLAPKFKKHKFIIAGSCVRQFFENSNINMQEFIPYKTYYNNKIHGYGWHYLEQWPEQLCGRWTKRKFGLYINKNISGIYLKTRSPKINKGRLIINKRLETDFIIKKNKLTLLEFKFNEIKNPFIEIELEKTIKPIGDPRELGIAIMEIGYIKNNKKLKLNLEKISEFIYSKKNIIFLSDLDNGEKKLLLKAADIAINPVFHGSGTNLKMFEYMAAGLPIVTTKFGARGIDGENMRHYIVCDSARFKRNIIKLLKNKFLYNTIKKNALKLVEEKYDWRVISNNLAKIIENNRGILEN